MSTIAGLADVFWQNSSDHTLVHWTLNGAQITSSQQVTLAGNPVAPDASWNVAGVGDFKGNGNADLLWRNSNGTLVEWTMNGSQILSSQNVFLGASAPTPDSSWNVAGLGDFNGDGNSDVLWRNNNGSLVDWTMNGSQIASSQAVTLGGTPVAPDASWNIAGFGDFNGDGRSDILWRNSNGTLDDWTMNGSQIASSQNVTLGGNPVAPDASWSVAGIGDFSGDGKSDILWRNVNGTLIDWTMNGSQIASSSGGHPGRQCDCAGRVLANRANRRFHRRREIRYFVAQHERISRRVDHERFANRVVTDRHASRQSGRTQQQLEHAIEAH